MRNGAIRLFVVVLSLAAWFALSNHCALGAVASPAASSPKMEDCPMHSAPAKKKPAPKAPCCKDLRAIVAKCVTFNPIALRLIAGLENTPQLFAQPSLVAIEIDRLDTGPPGYFSFAESVLQESMLSHAPPVS
jgi:hypothetical protein